MFFITSRAVGWRAAPSPIPAGKPSTFTRGTSKAGRPAGRRQRRAAPHAETAQGRGRDATDNAAAPLPRQAQPMQRLVDPALLDQYRGVAALAAIVASLGGAPIPIEGRRMIDGRLPAFFVVLAQEVHGARMAARGGELEPGKRSGPIPWPHRVRSPAGGRSCRCPVALEGGRAPVPAGGLRVVHRRTQAILAAAADHVHGHGHMGVGRRPKPMQRACLVARRAHPVDEQLAQQQLRVRLALRCMKAQARDGGGRIAAQKCPDRAEIRRVGNADG